MNRLETAAHPHSLKRVVIEPLTRVEGHGKVTLLVDDDNHIQQARLHIVEFRGFEKFIQGRPYWELPVLVQRLCGICPVSHHLAAAKAVDMIVGASRLTPTAEKVRRLMHLGQTLQSHALHFFHLSSPDLLFGFDDPVAHRNIVGVLNDNPELARRGIGLRRFGQEVIRVTAGKRVHGTGAIAGGVNKSLTVPERDTLLGEMDQMIHWSRDAVHLVRQLFEAHRAAFTQFAGIRSNMLSLVRGDGALDLYHGVLRAKDDEGSIILDGVDYRYYGRYLQEGIKPWSYMKFPFISSWGPERGWYRVGPLARINNCDFVPTPLAEAERIEYLEQFGGGPVHASLAYHWARMIEMLHAAEGIRELLADPDVLGKDLMTRGELQPEGIGLVEAPRGTLFHHYQVNEDGLITRANLIVSTTNNNQAMNEAIRHVAAHELDGRTLSEPLLNHLEVAIRAYDPCLSCATHALGKMPLEVELVNERGQVVDRAVRTGDGAVVCSTQSA
jgi:NAD-reducing hydrogenase large subunit